MTQLLALTAILFTYGYSTVPGGMGACAGQRAFVPALPVNAGYEIVDAVPEGSVRVAGRVVRPGDYDYYPGMTVESVIGDAGSFLNGTDYEGIRIARATPDGEKTYVVSWWVHWQRSVLLRPGDTLIVPNRSLVSY